MDSPTKPTKGIEIPNVDERAQRTSIILPNVDDRAGTPRGVDRILPAALLNQSEMHSWYASH